MPNLPRILRKKYQNPDYDDEHKFLRDLVFADQNGLCFYCRRTGVKELHHIDGNTKNKNRNNLQGICTRCHKLLHGKGYN